MKQLGAPQQHVVRLDLDALRARALDGNVTPQDVLALCAALQEECGESDRLRGLVVNHAARIDELKRALNTNRMLRRRAGG